MARKIKYGKLAVVLFITALIWVWADLALDETLPDKPAVVVVDESANPKLWVSFDQASSTDIRVTLSGPHRAIAAEDKKLKEGKKLEFYFDAASEKIDKPGDYPLTLLPFLKKNKEIKRRGLKVASCKPDTISVSVVKLAKKSLQIKCFDEDRNLLTATVQPTQVEMFVPEDWSLEKLTADVSLTLGEIDQARLAAIEKTPFVTLVPGGPIRKAPNTVKIKIPPEQDPRADYTITAATLGIALSPTLQGKYKVEIANLDAVMGPISVRATPEAIRAYELQPFPTMTLYILDDDKNQTVQLRREVIYNFPADYVRNKEIELKQQPVEARFKLKPLGSAESP